MSYFSFNNFSQNVRSSLYENNLNTYLFPWFSLPMHRYHQPSSQHFGVEMNFNNVVIFINLLFTKLRILRKTKDFLIPGIDYLNRIWHHFLEFWILNALQLCTCLALKIFGYKRHWWVLHRRNARLAYKITILVPLITIYVIRIFHALYYSFYFHCTLTS